MRLALLYVRSRHSARAVAGLAVLLVATWLWRHLSDGGAFNVALMITTLPLFGAAIVGASTGSAFGESEKTASYWLPILRVPHLAGLVVLAAAGLVVATTGWHGATIQWLLVRNLILFTGLALLTARVLGSGLAWVAAVGYGIAAMLTVPSDHIPTFAQQASQVTRWAWSLHAATDREAAVIATILLLMGLGIVGSAGAHDRPGDAT